MQMRRPIASGTPQGIRTLTDMILSHVPLPFGLMEHMVAMVGLGPTRLAAPDFESGTSANSITRPWCPGRDLNPYVRKDSGF